MSDNASNTHIGADGIVTDASDSPGINRGSDNEKDDNNNVSALDAPVDERVANNDVKKRGFLSEIPMPICIVNKDYIVTAANQYMKSVFAYDDIVGGNFFTLTGIKKTELLEMARLPEEDRGEIRIKRNEQVFKLETNPTPGEDEDLAVFFLNITEREELRDRYRKEHLCLLYISIDNYDELISSITTDSRLAVPTEVDRMIRNWADEYDATIESIGEDRYYMSLYRKDADRLIESKFQILDEIRSIETKIDFPVSLSIGMGMGAEELNETKELAEAAFDLAMGRGGDQAVVKNGNRTHYYGGKLQSMEKNNKGKSRVIAHALKQLIIESSRVIIMGHRWPDMDCFGGAIGAHRMCTHLDRDAYIVIEEHNEAMQVIFDQAKETEDYEIVNRKKAVELCEEGTLLIIVDTNRPGMLENSELLNKADKVVVIDHHRMSEDAIENPTLAYVESYASSASELMTEILQYTASKRIVNKFEAEALLAGITVDTNGFSIKTGVRTFEAAAWLRRAGADTTEVKRFFQTDIESFRTRANAIAAAEYLEGGIAMAISGGYSTEAQIINAQVADQLLMVKGVNASFAMGRNDRGKTVISARSIGEINVQVIMENFGGGGHLTSAGAQVDISPEEVMAELKRIMQETDRRDSEEVEQI